ncbi:uncharacterized protein si:dkey-22n8.3 isoform X2 [Puntigrus tetrazona]|nr:uncharacterized protein si:dkey-22n8.3 isoform X2 [Puntigrus tetrazona]
MLSTKYAASQAVESAESPTINAASAQEEMTTDISQASELSSTNPSEVIPSSEDVASAGESSDGTVYMPEVLISKVTATPAREKGHPRESFDLLEAVAGIGASALVNVAQSQGSSQPQSTRFQDFLAPAGEPSSGQEIITRALESSTDGTANSILAISSSEAVAVASGGDPTLREVCHEEAPSIVSSPQSTERLPVVETASASLSRAVDAMSGCLVSGDVRRSVSLPDPILVHTEGLEEEDQTEAAEELTEAQLDPVQKLFLDKIREYSTKSQASGGPVDAGPEYEKTFSEELNKLQRLYGSGGLTEFPEFKFSEPELDESSSK